MTKKHKTSKVSTKIYNALVADIFVDLPFFEQLEREVIRAVRGSTSLAVARFAIKNTKLSINEATSIIHQALKENGAACDSLGVLDDKNFAIVFPCTKIFKAQNMVEDILESCSKQSAYLYAGIAVLMGDKCSSKTLLDYAHKALEDAMEEQKNFCVYSVPIQDTQKNLVQTHEKRFLFGGGYKE